MKRYCFNKSKVVISVAVGMLSVFSVVSSELGANSEVSSEGVSEDSVGMSASSAAKAKDVGMAPKVKMIVNKMPSGLLMFLE